MRWLIISSSVRLLLVVVGRDADQAADLVTGELTSRLSV